MIASAVGAGAGAKALAAGAEVSIVVRSCGKQAARKAMKAAEEAAKAKQGPAGKALDEAGLEDDVLNPLLKTQELRQK